MKKLYLLTNDYPYGDGEGSFIEPELPYLMKHFDVTIVSTSLSKEKTVEVPDGIKVIHYDRSASLMMKLIDSICYLFHQESYIELGEIIREGGKLAQRLKDSVLFFEEARRFIRYIKREQCFDNNEDIIIYSYWYTFYVYSVLRLFKQKKKSDRRVKIISRAHRYDLYDEGYLGGRQPFKRYMNEYIDEIIFIAEHGRRYFLDRYSEQADMLKEKSKLFRLGVMPTMTEADDRQTDGTAPAGEDDEFILVSCAQMIARKRIDLIIEGLALIGDTNIKWVHFGGGLLDNELKELAKKKLDDKANITYEFAGNQNNETVLKYYEEHRIGAFITTTASEGCPVSVQEAMSYGIPIIGTEVAEIPYMIDGNGILISENPTAKEVSAAISDIAKMKYEQWYNMKNRSKEMWAENFNSNVNSEAFVKHLL